MLVQAKGCGFHGNDWIGIGVLRPIRGHSKNRGDGRLDGGLAKLIIHKLNLHNAFRLLDNGKQEGDNLFIVHGDGWLIAA